MVSENKQPRAQESSVVDPIEIQEATQRVLTSSGIPQPVDIFANYKEEEHPPYDSKIMEEAGEGTLSGGADLALADLIEQREIIYDTANSDIGKSGASSAIDPDQMEHMREELTILASRIRARKVEIGLEKPREPRKR